MRGGKSLKNNQQRAMRGGKSLKNNQPNWQESHIKHGMHFEMFSLFGPI
jgi:hypothetical protein